MALRVVSASVAVLFMVGQPIGAAGVLSGANTRMRRSESRRAIAHRQRFQPTQLIACGASPGTRSVRR